MLNSVIIMGRLTADPTVNTLVSKDNSFSVQNTNRFGRTCFQTVGAAAAFVFIQHNGMTYKLHIFTLP